MDTLKIKSVLKFCENELYKKVFDLKTLLVIKRYFKCVKWL